MDKYNKKAAQGIGTLVVFIALILVSGIAAAVLVQTATGLQGTSTGVSKQAEEKITKGVEIVQITVTDASDGMINDSDVISLLTRLSLGSEAVKLENLLVSFDSVTDSSIFEINPGALPNPQYYDVTYLTNGGVALSDGYIRTGELVRIEVISPVNVSESEKIEVGFSGSNVQTSIYKVTTPNAMVQNTLQLYP